MKYTAFDTSIYIRHLDLVKQWVVLHQAKSASSIMTRLLLPKVRTLLVCRLLVLSMIR